MITKGLNSQMGKNPEKKTQKKREREKEADPIIRISSNHIHVTTNEGQDIARYSPRILHNDIASALIIGDMVDDQRSSTFGCAVRKKRVQHVLHHSVFLWNQVRGIVLDVLGFPNQLREEAHEGFLVQLT